MIIHVRKEYTLIVVESYLFVHNCFSLSLLFLAYSYFLSQYRCRHYCTKHCLFTLIYIFVSNLWFTLTSNTSYEQGIGSSFLFFINLYTFKCIFFCANFGFKRDITNLRFSTYHKNTSHLMIYNLYSMFILVEKIS